MSDPDFSLTRRQAEKVRLASGGGGSDDGGMLEQRVAALESDMREVKASLGRIETLLRGFDERFRGFDDRLRRVEVDVAELKGRVSQLPTSWMMFSGGFGLILATSGFAFAAMRFGLAH